MSAPGSVAGAAAFVWLGMVLAISFLEAPLKFRAPGVTLPLGLGIGRLVFRALNACEVLLAAVLVVATMAGDLRPAAVAALGVVLACLAVQLIAIRPRLTRRSDAVLAGVEGPRSRAHLVYVGVEVAKVIALLVAGMLLLT